MAVTTTTRFALPQWSSGSDAPVNRAQLTGAFLALASKAAGYIIDTAANRPAAAASNAGYLFFSNDTLLLSWSDGSAWRNIPHGTYLPVAGGTLTGFVDFGGQEIRNAVVVAAADKVATANATGAVVIDAAAAGLHILTMTGNVSGITVNNLANGRQIKVVWKEDGTGGRTIAAAFTAAGWRWKGGVALGQSGFVTTANARNNLYLEGSEGGIEAFLVPELKT